jgi:hypothetical protein
VVRPAVLGERVKAARSTPIGYRDAPLLLIGEGASENPAHGHRPQADRPQQRMTELDALLKAHRSEAARLPAPAVSRYTREQIVASIERCQEQYGEVPRVVDWDPSWARRRGEDWRAERFETGE